jgi:hypothetical protein
MKKIIYVVIGSMVFSPAFSSNQAFATKSEEIERVEKQIDRLDKEHRESKTEAKRYEKEYRESEAELKNLEREKANFWNTHKRGPKGILDPRTQDEYKELEARIRDQKKLRDDLKSSWDTSKSDDEYNTKRDEYEERIKRIEKRVVSDDCPSGNCDTKKAAPNQKSGWENFADILKAATPLGLGAMGLYGAYKGAQFQSNDYRYYNANNTLLGLPSAPPNGYGGMFGAALGPALMATAFMNGSGGGGMFGGPMGMGFGGGMGFGLGGGLFGMPMMGMGMMPMMGMGMIPMGMGMGAGYITIRIGKI